VTTPSFFFSLVNKIYPLWRLDWQRTRRTRRRSLSRSFFFLEKATGSKNVSEGDALHHREEDDAFFTSLREEKDHTTKQRNFTQTGLSSSSSSSSSCFLAAGEGVLHGERWW